MQAQQFQTVCHKITALNRAQDRLTYSLSRRPLADGSTRYTISSMPRVTRSTFCSATALDEVLADLDILLEDAE